MSADLEAEVARLRAENEAHRQRQLAELQSALASAVQRAEGWELECRRVQQAGFELNAHKDEIISRLKDEIDTLRRIRPGLKVNANN